MERWACETHTHRGLSWRGFLGELAIRRARHRDGRAWGRRGV